jgi:hypothetical protein
LPLAYDLASIFSILVGFSIFGFWGNLSARGRLYEPDSTRSIIETKYHLAAELLTALILILGGVSTLLSKPWGVAVTLAGLGMLLYANINGPGLYAKKGDKQMVLIFYTTALLTVIVLLILIRTIV